MHYVLLVDDEAAVTRSLQHEIDWASLNLSVAAVARNGMEALAILENRTIDIVITDIRMADYDGLSLSRQISHMNQNIQIIIISGYAEFSYAQKALSYGVIGYCLKPVEYGELTRCLHLAVRKLEHSSKSSTYDDLLEALYNEKEDEIRRHLASLGFSAGQYYLAVSVSKKPLLTEKNNCLVLKLGHKHYGYILTVPIPLIRIQSYFSYTDCSSYAYSKAPVPAPMLGAVLRQLSNRSFHFFFAPDQKIIANTPEAASLSFRDPLAGLLAENKPARLASFLRELEKNAAQTLTLPDAWQMYNSIASSDIYGSLVAGDEIFTPEQLVYRYGTFRQMIDLICDRLKEFSPAPRPENMSNATFLHMVRYIDTHFAEDCFLHQLADEMNMSASYLGQLFKREAGKTYTAYITELRIKKARELLDVKDLSISEIATSLGFHDYFYFLKTFKRMVGVTPTQYRQGFQDNFLYTRPAGNGE